MKDDTSRTTVSDQELLRRFRERKSAPAFEELVARHLDHVFSAALRRVNGDHALAKDVTQTVFVDFARKAIRIPEDMPPGGWLHRHTGFVSSKMIDKEQRRRAREQEVAAMNTISLSATAEPDWRETAPLLDSAMDSLPAGDRDAIVLRFFEQKDFRSVGEALGVSDDTAQKRVSRAIDKLRNLFKRRGVASSGGALAVLLTANSVQAAPASLAGQISTQALVGAATAGATLSGALAGLTTAAKIKGSAALVFLAAVAGVAGSQLVNARPSAVDPSPQKVLARPFGEGAPAVSAPDPVPPAKPDKSMGVAALVAAAAAEWKGGRETVTATAKALGFIGQIDPAQIPKALTIAAALKDEPARSLVMQYLLTHWADRAPTKAMAWVDSEAAGNLRADVGQGMLNAWAARDPEAVMGWNAKAGARSSIRWNDSTVGTVFRTLAKRNPSRALDRLNWLRSPNQRGQALRGILETVQTDADRVEITSLISNIRQNDIRVQARRAMVEQWARQNAPAAAAFVETAEPAWERTRLMDSLGFTWLQSDPAAAAEWWTAQAPGPDTLVKIVNVWAQQDPIAASRWLDQQPIGPESDTARMTFSRQVADLDPERALLWAETVSDERMRESTIDHVYSNWRVRESAAAEIFLQNSNWPGERVTRLRDAANENQTSP